MFVPRDNEIFQGISLNLVIFSEGNIQFIYSPRFDLGAWEGNSLYIPLYLNFELEIKFSV